MGLQLTAISWRSGILVSGHLGTGFISFTHFDARSDAKLVTLVNQSINWYLGTTPGARLMNRKFAMSQVFSLLIGMALLLAANAYHPAIAASLRCPTPDIGVLWTPTPTIPPVHAPPPVHVPEARRINELWLDFGGTPDGSDGPFGCPIGYAEEAADPGTIWTGVKQRFQRGWIIIGRENLAGFEVAAVRGLNGWTVWWQGSGKFGAQLRASEAPPNDLFPSGAPTAAWSWGGHVLFAPASSVVALWQCTNGGPLCMSWTRVTPFLDVSSSPLGDVKLDGSSRPFDAAARLDRNQLSKPDPSEFLKRTGAVFSSWDWLPCHTYPPKSTPDLGEDDVARALVMIRRPFACPLTHKSPRAEATDWLSALILPPGQLPGTNVEDWPCIRKGELDVTLVGLMHLAFQYRNELGPAVLGHIRTITEPWGVVHVQVLTFPPQATV